jgi:hypothetical protein
MTKQIRRILATAAAPLTTSQIAAIASRNLGLAAEDMVNEQFREKICYRPKAMAARGQVLRHHIDDSSVKNGLEGCWSPAPSGSTKTAAESHIFKESSDPLVGTPHGLGNRAKQN